MAGANPRLLLNRRIKEAMKRPEVQAKLHAPRKGRRLASFKAQLLAAMEDAEFMNRVRTLFPSTGALHPPVPTTPGRFWLFTGRVSDPSLRWVEGTAEFDSKVAAEEAARSSGSNRPLYVVGPFQNRPASVENHSAWTFIPAKVIPPKIKKQFMIRRKK